MGPVRGSGTRIAARAQSDLDLAKAVAEYEALLCKGQSVDRATFLARHLEIRDELEACLSGLDLVHKAARRLADRRTAAAGEPSLARPGVRLGDFVLRREVGRGGMGIVYEAVQVSLRRRVALKVLPFAGALDPKQLARFEHEARAAALLHHSNIVPVFSIGCERGVHFYAMQFIDGTSLARVIEAGRERRRNGLDPGIDRPAYLRTAARLGIQAAAALSHAHARGVVHRDIKPANLLLDRQRKLWVSDFGLARIEGEHGLTVTGDVLGTLRYMSPEQATASRDGVDHRADVYSLGVTLYEVLALEHPFQGRTRLELLGQIASPDAAPPISRRNPAVPADLETVVLKAMAKDPAQRYGTARELAEDLHRWLEGRPILARRPSPAVRAAKWCRRHKPLVASAAAGLVALAAVTGFLHARARESERLAFERYQREVLDAITLLDSRDVGLLEDERHAAGSEPTEEEPPVDAPRWVGAWIDEQAKAWPRQLNGVEAAADLLADAVTLFPRRPEAHLYRTRALLALGRKEEAAAEAERALELDPESLLAAEQRQAVIEGENALSPLDLNAPAPGLGARARFELAWIASNDALKRQRWKEAASSASEALAALRAWGGVCVGAQFEVVLARGVARFNSKDYHGAIEDMGAARVLAPHVGFTGILLMKAYYRSDDKDRAAALAEEHHKLGKPPDAAAIAIANAYFELMDNQASLAWARRIEHEGLRSQESAFYLCELWRCTDALEEARKAVRLMPMSLETYQKLQHVLVELGLVDEAIEATRARLRLEPKAAAGHFNLGTFLMDVQRYGEAELELQEALRLDPGNPAAYTNLAEVYRVTHRPELALENLAKGFEVDPDFLEAHKALRTRSQVHVDQGDLPAAIADMREAVRRRPMLLYLRHQLTDLLHKNHQYEEALDVADECLQIRPADGISYFNRGVILKATGKRDEAIASHLRGEEMDPSYTLSAIELGTTFHDRGDCEQSIDHFRKALERPRKRNEDGFWVFWFADCLQQTGKEVEGLELFQKALPAFEALPIAEQIGNRARRYVVSELLGCLSSREFGEGRVDEARVFWAKMDSLYRHQAESPRGGAQDWNDWAWALLDFGPEALHDPKRALEHAKRAVELSKGKDATFLDTLALACFKNGNLEHAVKIERMALALLPPPAPGDETTQLLLGNDITIGFARKALSESLKTFEAAHAQQRAENESERKDSRKVKP